MTRNGTVFDELTDELFRQGVPQNVLRHLLKVLGYLPKPQRALLLATVATSQGYYAAATELIKSGRLELGAGELFDGDPPSWLVEFQRGQVVLAHCCGNCRQWDANNEPARCRRWETETTATDGCSQFEWKRGQDDQR